MVFDPFSLVPKPMPETTTTETTVPPAPEIVSAEGTILGIDEKYIIGAIIGVMIIIIIEEIQ